MAKDIDINTSNMDIGLDDVNVDMSGGLDMGLDDMKMKIEPLDIVMGGGLDMGLDNMKMDMGLDDVNVCLNFAIKEVPNLKVHMPVNYEFGFEVLGFKLFNFCLGGKSMIVTEDNPTRMFYKKTQTKQGHITNQPGFKVSIEEKE